MSAGSPEREKIRRTNCKKKFDRLLKNALEKNIHFTTEKITQ